MSTKLRVVGECIVYGIGGAVLGSVLHDISRIKNSCEPRVVYVLSPFDSKFLKKPLEEHLVTEEKQ
jgi:hypothetical protein